MSALFRLTLSHRRGEHGSVPLGSPSRLTNEARALSSLEHAPLPFFYSFSASSHLSSTITSHPIPLPLNMPNLIEAFGPLDPQPLTTLVPHAIVEGKLTAPGSQWEIEERVINGVLTKTWKHVVPSNRDLWVRSAKVSDL